MVAFLTWQRGRQDSGYEKMLLASARWPIPFDLYVLRYPRGSYVWPHVDPVTEGRHWRLNFVFWKARSGGFFWKSNDMKTLRRGRSRWHLFRPDVELHGVTAVTDGSRYVLSLGWILGDR